MRKYLKSFMEEYKYPEEAQKTLLEVYEKVKNDEKLTYVTDNYYKEKINIDKPEGPLGEISTNMEINFYTLKLLTYLILTKDLKEEYLKRGISQKVYYDTVEDLKYKMKECLEVYGVWGIFSPGWYNNVFRLKTFVLGRLAYNMGVYEDVEVKIAGRTIKKGSKVINIHIPSSGKPFDKEARIYSYSMAAEFFKEEFSGEYPVFKCDSWLLYEKHKEILGEKSNITSFINDFKIVISKETDDSSNFLWRVFGKDYMLPPEELPENTSMRRAFRKWLIEGKKLGGGMGLFVFNTEKRITES